MYAPLFLTAFNELYKTAVKGGFFMSFFSAKAVIKSNRGVSLVIVDVSLTVITICAALSVDVGTAAIGRARLSTALDAAALAGAQEFISNRDDIESIVRTYVEKNTDNLREINTTIDTATKVVQVNGIKTQKSFFARILGVDMFNISVTAAAKIENISSLDGARPLAVVQQDFTYGELYTLKVGAGDGSTGNFGAIALGGSGNTTYRNNLLSGYNGIISVGDQIQTEPGNMAGTTETTINQLVHNCTHSPQCTYESYNRNCSRIIFLPVVDTLNVNGRSYVKVLGFATFFLEGITGHGGHAEVKGRFITYNMDGQTSSDINDYGTYGIRLIK